MTDARDDQIGVLPGDVLAGKYRVERVLGAGGMGVVVAAHHLQLDQRVALKFLRPAALKNDEAVGRFVREARAAAKITNEHVARVSDVGQLESGSPYIVMEYLEGVDLAGWLRQRGPLPIELAVDFVLQTCEAIADAHAIGIVHRDLKPANLFCVQRSDGHLSIKVLDFGISKVMTPGAVMSMTRTNALVGSPYYMSPEQMQSSKSVDGRTDVWSLGIILFELVSGRMPFDSESVTDLAIKVAMTPAPPVRAFRAECPAGVEQVILRCLEKDPARRFQTVGELAVALEAHASRKGQASIERVVGTLRQAGLAGTGLASATPSVAPPGPAPSPATHAATAILPSTSSSWGHSASTTRAASKAPLVAVAVLGALAVLGGGGAFLALRTPPAAAPSDLRVPPVASASAAAASEPPSAAIAPPSTSIAPPSTSIAPPAETAMPSATSLAALPAPSFSPSAFQAHAKPAAGPAPAGAAGRAGAGAPRPGCDPSYTLDDQGRKHFKPECFLSR